MNLLMRSACSTRPSAAAAPSPGLYSQPRTVRGRANLTRQARVLAALAGPKTPQEQEQQLQPDHVGSSNGNGNGNGRGLAGQEEVQVVASGSGGGGREMAHLRAAKVQAHSVQERQRPLAEYMALPVSQYSVLDARKIERIDDQTFRCYVGALSFFSWSVEPVLTVSVTAQERGCTIRMLSCKLSGSRFTEDINRRFSATMTNEVCWRNVDGATAAPPHASGNGVSSPPPAAAAAAEGADRRPSTGGDVKELTSSTSIEVVLEIPRWFSLVPASSISSVGSGVMQAALNTMVPRFLQQLQLDYELWAAGDESRKPASTGEL